MERTALITLILLGPISLEHDVELGLSSSSGASATAVAGPAAIATGAAALTPNVSSRALTSSDRSMADMPLTASTISGSSMFAPFGFSTLSIRYRYASAGVSDADSDAR